MSAVSNLESDDRSKTMNITTVAISAVTIMATAAGLGIAAPPTSSGDN
jgi:hypothetical protein